MVQPPTASPDANPAKSNKEAAFLAILEGIKEDCKRLVADIKAIVDGRHETNRKKQRKLDKKVDRVMATNIELQSRLLALEDSIDDVFEPGDFRESLIEMAWSAEARFHRSIEDLLAMRCRDAGWEPLFLKKARDAWAKMEIGQSIFETRVRRDSV